ncbi:HAD-IA family hydrolase [Rhodoblastus acidophilus]|uniref:HAD-IA family hydrolase n=1 Tax=Candidatus Rhodoblastus alkanivorans TaxID=2954117 RepID=A0ABS9Z5N4_9HYPH|nr:HAD-IA family hydrolase [Candidatus Rhodoblastus alkanivorans]MCI4682931.1 HAD-IA family hydrolase [Candidatus Rhodoblastus alkanivorans]MDI4640241.1 HAD-IA family hydrolase [Rhodoblastus acidophilus]
MKLIIFDIDGTLVDSQNCIVEAQRRAFAALGLPAPPTREKALSVVGLSLVEAFDALTEGRGPSKELADAYKAAWMQLRGESRIEDRCPVYPGVEEFLRQMSRRDDCRLGVATGKSRAGVDRLFDAYGWRDMFATVQTADDAPSKPAPDMFNRALAETSMTARDACMVGDTVFDMRMARSAGAHAIGVGWGYHPHEKLTKAGAVTIADNLDALRVQLDEFMQCVTT